jgi:flavin-dependent dehydrogenase
MFVGDAAGTIDPFSGEGMSNAMRAAEIAEPFVLRAVGAGALDERLAAEYTRRWTAEFAPVTRRVRRIGRLFEHPRIAAPVVRWLSGPAASLLPRLVSATRTGA